MHQTEETPVHTFYTCRSVIAHEEISSVFADRACVQKPNHKLDTQKVFPLNS